MAGIQLMGLGSGMDTGAMLDSLMAIERQPRQKIAYKQVAAEARKTALTDIQSRLNTLKFASTDLGGVLAWGDTQTVSSSNDAKLAAVRNGGVGPGTYSFDVTQMASAARSTYSFTSPPSDINATISCGAKSKTLTIKAGAGIDDTVAQINADSDTGVFAVNVAGKLVLSSRTTGAADTIAVSTDLGGPVAADEVVAGKDARFSIDGGAVQTSATNTIKNAIPGLDVTLKGLTGAGGESVTVGAPSPDLTKVKDKIRSFISAYNDTQTAIRTRYEEKGVFSPQNNVDAAKGSLYGDSGLSQIMSTLRSTVGGPVGGSDPSLSLLAQIGISTGGSTGDGTLNQDAITGKLVFDETKFDAAYAADPSKVKQLLGVSGGGFAQAFSAAINGYSSTDGALGGRIVQADSAIQTVKSSLDAFDKRLELRQQYLQNQFTQMESALSQSKALGSQLSAQLAGLLR